MFLAAIIAAGVVAYLAVGFLLQRFDGRHKCADFLPLCPDPRQRPHPKYHPDTGYAFKLRVYVVVLWGPALIFGAVKEIVLPALRRVARWIAIGV